MFIFVVIITCVIEPVFGFYPRQPPYWTTKTHVDIINTGVLQTIAEYIINHNLTNSPSLSTTVDDFFGPGKYFTLECCSEKEFKDTTGTKQNSEN